MTILELANRLKEIYDQRGDIEVMFLDPNSNDGPFAVGAVAAEVVEDPEDFPAEFNMPKGFEYVLIEN
jgi:hypothetical protein